MKGSTQLKIVIINAWLNHKDHQCKPRWLEALRCFHDSGIDYCFVFQGLHGTTLPVSAEERADHAAATRSIFAEEQ
jgi:hypothetical protein